MYYSQAQYDEAQAELLGDGFTNEYQRCYFETQLARPLKDERALAKQLHGEGRVVVVAQFEVCCRVTDALIGYDYLVVANFATQAEAIAYLEDCDPESRYIFEPFVAPVPEPTTLEDEIPF